jgi:hypothetical protein
MLFSAIYGITKPAKATSLGWLLRFVAHDNIPFPHTGKDRAQALSA